MSSPAKNPEARQTITRFVVGLTCLVVASALLGFLSHDTIEELATVFVDRNGLWGIVAATCIADTVFLLQEPILLVGWTGGLGFWPTVLAASFGSILGGMNGWLLGRVLGRTPWMKRKLASSRMSAFMQKYGGWAVAVAAITPFPYGAATWASGATRVPFLHVLAGSLLRFPKILFYLWMLTLGWSLASGTLFGLGLD